MTDNLTPAMRYAVIFPGQGSQSIGMLADWTQTYPQVMQTFERASAALGFDLWAICQGTHPEFNLDNTAYTQPALLTASMAIWQVLTDELAIAPAYLAGHSLGEYSALCAAGVLTLEDAVRLVHHRGQYMSEAVQGVSTKMAALLGLDDEQVSILCEQIREQNSDAIVSPANFNAVGQVVIAGNSVGVDRVIEQVVILGKKAVPLNVSVPSHCQLMQPASEKLAQQLAKVSFTAPKIPVIQNRHAQVEADIKHIKQALIEQLSMPVLWSKTEEKLAAKHITLQIECGSGNVLTNLAKRQSQKITTLATDKVSKLADIKQALPTTV